MTNQQDCDFTLKILLKGSPYVGKTSLFNKITILQNLQPYQGKIGIDFKQKTIEKLETFIYNKKIILQIWDRTGSERFRNTQSNEVKNLEGFVFVYDITNRYTFERIKYIIEEQIQNIIQDNVVLVLVGNKCDLEMQRVVSYNEGQQLANSLGMDFYETSAKSSQNVNICFENLIDYILLIQ